MRVRIENDGKHRYATKITDAETGEPFGHVTSAIIQFDANEGSPTAILVVATPVVDVIVDAEVKHVCPCCGREKAEEEETLS